MDQYLRRILHVLNAPLERAIKNGHTKGWQYKTHRNVSCGVEYALVVPVGLSYSEAEKRLEGLMATCGKPVELEDYKGSLVVRVIEKPLERMVPFKPEMLNGLRPGEILIGIDVLGRKVTFNWELPHGIIAGETGMGKTDCIRLITYCLLQEKIPVDIRIIDLKLLSFLPFRNVPNITVGTGLNAAKKMLQEAADEVTRRNSFVEQSGNRKATKSLQKIVVIIDEAADLSPSIYKEAAMKKFAAECERYISTIARMGREVRVHLLYCTQYPTAAVLSSQIKINCGMRLCFYVPTFKNSEVVLERGGAENLEAMPGRAIFKSNLYTTIQVPYVGNDDEWEKMLAPFKQEVIHGGHSARSKPERTYLEGVTRRADSVNETARDTVPQQPTTEQGQLQIEGARGRRVSGMGLAPENEGVEAQPPRALHAPIISDEI